jgi:antitoxin component YwqK of YwqJK toxin-antitoxin module
MTPVTEYKKGEIVYPDHFDESSIVCSNGIHYFKSVDAAYYYGQPHPNYTGSWIVYTDNGDIHMSGTYKNGHKNDVWTEWYITDRGKENDRDIDRRYPLKETTFKDGRQFGRYIEYHDGSNQISVTYNLIEGVMTGDYKSYYHNDKIHIEGRYDRSGQKRGVWRYYDSYGYQTHTVEYSDEDE